MFLQWGWTDTVFPYLHHDWRMHRYSIRKKHQVNTPLFEGPAGTCTCYFNNVLPFCIIFGFSFINILFSYLSHLLMYFSIFLWICERFLWFYFSPCEDTKTTCQCSMLFKKLQELYKKSTPVDYRTAITFFLVIFVLLCFFFYNCKYIYNYYNYKGFGREYTSCFFFLFTFRSM